jgi:hypothetical protein
MHETHDSPRNVLVAVLFCAIIGIITYAGVMQGGFSRAGLPYALSKGP